LSFYNQNVSDTAFAASWNGNLMVPTKNAVYDKIETLTTGAASSTDNAVARYDLTTGKIIQNSAATVSDDGIIRSSTNSAANPVSVPLCNWLMQTADYTLTNTANEQKLFDQTTNGTLTLPSGVYEFEAFIYITTMSASSGNAAFDGQDPYSTDATANKTVSGLNTAGSETVNGESVLKDTLFAPATSGDFIISGKGTNTAGTGTAFALSATVEADQSASLALDAANAATDAANNAYDEAQNATQAASDALAAVTALAAQVKTLIASVKKLTAAVAKLK
jgi:hypothetical protein